MKKEIIPSIDLMDGKCVRLMKGDFRKKEIYFNDPVEYVKKLQDHGLNRVHVVDLDGAATGAVVHWGLLEKICSFSELKVDFGGGIKKEDELKRVFEAGAACVSLSGAAVRDLEETERWITLYGAGRFILCPDISGGYIRISGWTENSGVMVNDFIRKYLKKGIKQFLCTDIGRDGMMTGPSFGLYRDILSEFRGIDLIASGGVAGMDDVLDLFSLGVAGVVIGRAVFEGSISLSELSQLQGRLRNAV